MWQQICYLYDGTLDGFLTCVYESYAKKEYPMAFASPEESRVTLYPEREVTAHEAHARLVFSSLGRKISPEARRLVAYGFLTCLPEREVHLYEFIRMCYEVGPSAARRLTDERVAVLTSAVGHLTREAELLRGFVRFSEYGGRLAGEIEPKNRVLPLLKGHFCTRFPGEVFVLYDRTHREALFHQPGKTAILPVEDFRLAAAEEEERFYRGLWRRFYDTIAIEGRINPKLRRTHMPKRYWGVMTEFQEE